MISFLVTSVIVVVFVFILVVVLSLMAWVITRLLRFLFPQRFAQAAKAVQAKKEKLIHKKGEKLEDRCPSCGFFGSCPAGMHMSAPCRFYVEASQEALQ